MRLLYIQEKPIQNDLPFQYIQRDARVQMQVIFINEGNEHQTIENLNAQVFNFKHQRNYNHVFLYKEKEPLLYLKKAIQRADVVVTFGYYHRYQKISIILAKFLRKKLVITTDSTSDAGTAYSTSIKQRLKPVWIRFLYNTVAHGVWVPSTTAFNYLLDKGIDKSKIALTPYVVDEIAIIRKAEETDIPTFRLNHQFHLNDFVFVFCAKFIDRKRPLDVLVAVNSLKEKGYDHFSVWMIGDGPLKQELMEYSHQYSLNKFVQFPGFVDYEELPAWYTSANALVFTSSHEPYGLPVNEAMLCGIPVIVSDQIGAAKDLVNEQTGMVYPVGDTNALMLCMETMLLDNSRVQEMGNAAKKMMMNWGSDRNYREQVAFFTSKNWL
ncbi:MAG: glycosyltransferase family 4 protein [Hydrotalea sp.]|nr:glycosyltransferase family 4 protein [Hydrotalea sp.]